MGVHHVDLAKLPPRWPTDGIPAEFWEELGRAVACFGLLEEILGKAIFALTAAKPHDVVTEKMVTAWVSRLKGALRDPLGKLIESFEQALSEETHPAFPNWQELVASLRRAAEVRNAICHASWRPGAREGLFMPFFVNWKLEAIDTEFDAAALVQIQRHVAELICNCINAVTLKGLQFPGSDGPGQPIR
jgi:hypothetical protein